MLIPRSRSPIHISVSPGHAMLLHYKTDGTKKEAEEIEWRADGVEYIRVDRA